MPFEGIAKKGESLYDFPIVRVGGSPRDREIPAAHRLSVKFLPCIALSRPVASRVAKPRLTGRRKESLRALDKGSQCAWFAHC